MTGTEVAALAGWTDGEEPGTTGTGPGETLAAATGEDAACPRCDQMCPCECDESALEAEADVLGIDAGDCP